MPREPILIENIWYVYRHIRLDKQTPFYIGIGCTANYKRAYSRASRNKRWLSIIKSSNYDVEIIFDNLSKNDATIKEIEFIKLYGRECNGGLLCNQTDGGEGVFGRQNIDEWKRKLSIRALQMSDEHKAKISASKKGKPRGTKGIALSEAHKKQISVRLKGKPKTGEHRLKVHEANLGKKLSDDTKKKISNWNQTVGHSLEAKAKMSKAASYKRSDETKKKMSEARKRYFLNKKQSYAP